MSAIFLIYAMCLLSSTVLSYVVNPLLRSRGLEKNVLEIREEAARVSLDKIQSSFVKVPTYISTEPVEVTYTKYGGSSMNSNGKDPLSFAQRARKRVTSGVTQPPIVFIHGFDSSSVEFRRLAPLLGKMGQEVYCVDILGWGFSNVSNVNEFTPRAKVDHLECFIRQVVGRDCILGGASLGGAVAINLYAQAPDLVSKLVLIDAQGFIDGEGPSEIPNFIAGLGIEVLKSKPLRMFANYIAYSDKSFATADAMLIGRLHCDLKSWKSSSIDFLKSGGFVTSEKVAKVKVPTLVLWGSNDEILEPSTAEKFRDVLRFGYVKYISDCGHVCHLERPKETAEEIVNFVNRGVDKMN